MISLRAGAALGWPYADEQQTTLQLPHDQNSGAQLYCDGGRLGLISLFLRSLRQSIIDGSARGVDSPYGGGYCALCAQGADGVVRGMGEQLARQGTQQCRVDLGREVRMKE